MDKWDYISKISNLSDKYGNLLLDMMEKHNKYNLIEITYEEAIEFYENLLKENKGNGKNKQNYY